MAAGRERPSTPPSRPARRSTWKAARARPRRSSSSRCARTRCRSRPGSPSPKLQGPGSNSAVGIWTLGFGFWDLLTTPDAGRRQIWLVVVDVVVTDAGSVFVEPAKRLLEDGGRRVVFRYRRLQDDQPVVVHVDRRERL